MIGSVVFSQLLFLGECIKDSKKENRWLGLPIGIREIGRTKRILFTVLACLLAVLIGGNNFATSVSTMCLLLCLQIVFLICRKDAFRRTWIITLLETLSVLKCVTSPLTATRLNGNFCGSVANTPIMAILLSFERTFLNIITLVFLRAVDGSERNVLVRLDRKARYD